jgi:hypothetical protein
MFDAKSLQNPFAAAFEMQIARTESFFAQMAELEAKAVSQAQRNFDEQARLARESMTYAGSLAAEWRKASLDMLRRSSEMMKSPLG